jgi:beta-xylosidase
MKRRERSVPPSRRLAAGWLAFALSFLLAACGGQGGQSPAASPGGSPAPQPSPTASRSPGPGEFDNPVIAQDFPDPHVLQVGGMYFAYATGGGGKRIQVARSRDLVKWELLADALPELPAFSTGDTWAPEVTRTTAGFVMYYTLRAPDLLRPDASGSQCISFAVAPKPEGPFRDPNRRPFLCQPDLGGSIDATYFRDRDGTPYLVWKNDGNCCELPTRFFIQQLSPDGRRLLGQPREIGERNDQPWEGAVVEAPTLLLRDGTYNLFYSGNAFNSQEYAVGYATASKVTGPYRDAPENPILKTRDEVALGPGHQTIIPDKDGDLWMVYHAYDPTYIGGPRHMWLDELVFENGKPVVKGPDDGPQPAP